jgi:hypothetical protein
MRESRGAEMIVSIEAAREGKLLEPTVATVELWTME